VVDLNHDEITQGITLGSSDNSLLAPKPRLLAVLRLLSLEIGAIHDDTLVFPLHPVVVRVHCSSVMIAIVLPLDAIAVHVTFLQIFRHEEQTMQQC
jgi:hypothetical protein